MAKKRGGGEKKRVKEAARPFRRVSSLASKTRAEWNRRTKGGGGGHAAATVCDCESVVVENALSFLLSEERDQKRKKEREPSWMRSTGQKIHDPFSVRAPSPPTQLW